MRYAIISDIHSNLEALVAVLDALTSERIDTYYCIGDIVGYGADPVPCLKKIKEHCLTSVLGNHDAGCVGSLDLLNFNQAARSAVVWTKKKLKKEDLDYLKNLELVVHRNSLTFVHGTLVKPEDFNYMFDLSQARESFNKMTTNIVFVGHSHVPGIFEKKNQTIKYFYKHKLNFSKDARYIVNAGSVGQPRDGDKRACFVIYDSQKKEILTKRVEYDIGKAQKKILDAGLPAILAERLLIGA